MNTRKHKSEGKEEPKIVITGNICSNDTSEYHYHLR